MPGKRFGTRWAIVLDTADDGSAGQPGTADSLRPGDRLQRTGGSMIVLRRTAPS